MKANVGGWDRKLRIGAGLAIIGTGVVFGSWFGALGLIPLTTGLTGRCPAYCPLKVTTNRKD